MAEAGLRRVWQLSAPGARLDDWMPDSTALVRERHALRIAASPTVVYQALWEADFGGPIATDVRRLAHARRTKVEAARMGTVELGSHDNA